MKTKTTPPTPEISVTGSRAAFEAEAIKRGMNIERSERAPHLYKYQHASDMWTFWQAAEDAAIAREGIPTAWARRWFADGVEPVKVQNEQNRWVWPPQFKLLPLSKEQIQSDDVPLFRFGSAAAHAAQFTRPFAQAIIDQQERAPTPACVFCGGADAKRDKRAHTKDCAYEAARAYLATNPDAAQPAVSNA